MDLAIDEKHTSTAHGDQHHKKKEDNLIESKETGKNRDSDISTIATQGGDASESKGKEPIQGENGYDQSNSENEEAYVYSICLPPLPGPPVYRTNPSSAESDCDDLDPPGYDSESLHLRSPWEILRSLAAQALSVTADAQQDLPVPMPPILAKSDTTQSVTNDFRTDNYGNGNVVHNGSHISHEDNQGNMRQHIQISLPPPTPPVQIGPYFGFRIPADRGSCGQHYTRLMLNPGEGYPLWCPEPEERDPPLPETYKKTGIGIGDVGVIHQDKPFDFLFNITVPKDNPVNETVPTDFAPISMEGLQFRNGSRQMNHHIGGPTHCWDRDSFQENDYTRYTFSHAQNEAAILMLPEGSAIRELKTRKTFSEFAKRNGKAWIDYANTHRHTRDLYLITAWEKCSAWGTASHVRRQHEDSVALPFTVHPDATYEWGHHKGCESKAFPRPGHGNAEEKPVNQTVFVRGFRISVVYKKSIWGKKKHIVDVEYGPDDDRGQWGRVRSPGGSGFSPGGSGFSTGSSSSGATENQGNGGQSIHGGYSRDQDPTGGRAIFGKLTHPCDIINTLLHAIAEKTLNGEDWDGIAISHDNDWISATQKLDTPLSPHNVQEFLREVIKNIPYTIDREHNTIYTELSDESSTPKDKTPLDDVVDEVAKEVIARYCTWFSEENDQEVLILDAPAQLAHVPAIEVVNV
ncbi:hypothetical protein VNI00_019224 [Paramarasmius palmivorus]|uniref:Uncharacterized protein n=1 Tax=Paramarasmius palmivorus TaxID=297713 RepID=A0AAW0APY4_9AGAR